MIFDNIPHIRIFEEKKFIGRKLKMSLKQDQTFDLWNRFMTQYRKPAKPAPNYTGTDLYSIQAYSDKIFNSQFDENTLFDKWAAVEVENFDNIQNDMETLTIKSGLYAVFIHRGLSSDFNITMRFIMNEWLPTSGYHLDNRPHFEIMGDRYKNNHPDSEEEVWVPIELI